MSEPIVLQGYLKDKILVWVVGHRDEVKNACVTLYGGGTKIAIRINTAVRKAQLSTPDCSFGQNLGIVFIGSVTFDIDDSVRRQSDLSIVVKTNGKNLEPLSIILKVSAR